MLLHERQKTNYAHRRSSNLEMEDVALQMQASWVAVVSSSRWFHHKAVNGEYFLLTTMDERDTLGIWIIIFCVIITQH